MMNLLPFFFKMKDIQMSKTEPEQRFQESQDILNSFSIDEVIHKIKVSRCHFSPVLY